MWYPAGSGTSAFEYLVLGSVAAALLAYVLIVFWLVVRAPDYSRAQKAAQLFLAIVLPVLGVALVWAFVLLRRRQARTP